MQRRTKPHTQRTTGRLVAAILGLFLWSGLFTTCVTGQQTAQVPVPSTPPIAQQAHPNAQPQQQAPHIPAWNTAVAPQPVAPAMANARRAAVPTVQTATVPGSAAAPTRQVMRVTHETPAEPDAEAVAAQAAELAEAKMMDVKNSLMAAINGDRGAISHLITNYVVPGFLVLIGIMIGYMVASFVGRVMGQLVSRRVDLTLGRFVGKMITNLILLLVGLGVLGYAGIDVSSFAAILAACGFAVGMALQGTLSNFAAGIMLLVFRPFKVNDYVKVGGIEGTVEEISLFTTSLNSLDNRHLIVPNSEIFGATIENVTRNEFRRVDVNVGAAYSADIRHTREVLSNAIAVIPGAVTDPMPEVYLVELADSSVNWQCRVWCRPENYWDVRQRTTAAVKDSMDAANISIPFPQIELTVGGDVIPQRAAA